MHKTRMTRNGLSCAAVPLLNNSLAHSLPAAV